jgi:hypothetical protein
METKMKETILEREMMDGRALATYRRVVLVGLIVLLLGACGQAEEEASPAAPLWCYLAHPAKCKGFSRQF